MAKRRKRRRHISFGTFLMIVLTAGTLCLAGLLIVRLAGDDLRVQTAQIFSEITGSMRMPGMPKRPDDRPSSAPAATRAAEAAAGRTGIPPAARPAAMAAADTAAGAARRPRRLRARPTPAAEAAATIAATRAPAAAAS